MSACLISSLRSVDVGLADVAAAAQFYVNTWHLQIAATSGTSVYLRGSGADHHLLALHQSEQSEVQMISFRATSVEALPQLAASAIAHGATVLQGPAPIVEPGGGLGLVIRDPQGRILRFIAGDQCQADSANESDRPIRLAHTVLNSRDVAAGQEFYQNALGMKLSDRTGIMAFIRIPVVPQGDHHSIALADADNDCLNHIAFVMPDLDAVMRGGGRMKDAGYEIEWGPGRHGPGNNSFNYFVGPGGFVIEYTADVQQIDDSYPVRGPTDWKWRLGRFDHWGISAAPSARLKQAQRLISFRTSLREAPR